MYDVVQDLETGVGVGAAEVDGGGQRSDTGRGVSGGHSGPGRERRAE
jgi:hypothetical protein